MTKHPTAELGALALGALEPDETRAIEEHVAGCPDCRAELAELRQTSRLLDLFSPAQGTPSTPDGPAPEDDLVVARLLGAARRERSSGRRRAVARMVAVAAAALVIGGAGATAIVTAGDDPGESGQVAAPSPAEGSFVLAGRDTATGVTADITVEPAGGGSWVRLTVIGSGFTEGVRCQVFVVTTSGERVDAGSWTVWFPPPGSVRRPLELSAAVPADEIASVGIETFDGDRLVAATA